MLTIDEEQHREPAIADFSAQSAKKSAKAEKVDYGGTATLYQVG